MMSEKVVDLMQALSESVERAKADRRKQSTNDTRPIPELMGWRPPLAEWGYTEGHWEHPTSGVVVNDHGGWDCDDMLEWLNKQSLDIEIDYGRDGVSVWLKRWDDWAECYEPGPRAGRRSTLHAALEAAVRAVAEASDG